MDERKQLWKDTKKALKKAKKKTIQPWKGLCITFIVLSLIMTPLAVVANIFDNTLVALLGGTFWKVIDEDPNAQYFTSDFKTDEEMYAAGTDLCYQVEAEGAALLLNNNNALPLAAGSKVTTLSSSSVELVYGGTGSGNVDASKADDLKAALEKSGFKVNGTMWDFYKNAGYSRAASAGESAVLAGQSNIAEVPMSEYPQNVKDSVASYGDAAIITFSRVGGEGYDLEFQSMNYLALSQEEKDLLSWAKEQKDAGKIKKIIVLINTSNALQVDFLKNDAYGVDACLWIGGVGIAGTNAVTDILAGKVNPSGSLVDTYCYNNMTSPAMQNFVATQYKGDLSKISANAKSYMIYQEGIYVGYKYYETRYEDAIMGTGNTAGYVYHNDVAFPFGYGLSYTTFEYSDFAVSYDVAADQYKVTLTVTNTGDVAGKETVQIYAQSPYTDYDKANGVEKAAVQLCGFGKTSVLEKGTSEKVTILVDKRDLAAYDAYGYGTYILDAGDYYLTAATDAHNAVNNILAAKGFRGDEEGNVDLVHSWKEAELDHTTYAVSKTGVKIENQLQSAEINDYFDGEYKLTYLSRSDWEGTWPTEETVPQLALNDKLIADLQDVLYKAEDYEKVPMPTLGADNGMKLISMRGKDFNDPDWQKLLDQLTFDEMVSAIGDSFHWRMPVESVNAPGTRDENGPQGLTAAIFGAGLGDIEPTAFTSEDVMAATFNRELIYDVGNMIGNNCLAADVVCLYGPGANTHRTPYGGRNFEYYSEDGFLAGEMCASEVRGLQDKGVDVVLKHFALNDCEQDRLGQAAWVGEQAAREIYLKAFQQALEPKEIGGAGGNGVMTSYTRWGTRWSGSHKNLMTNIMRLEWGNQGMSITDNVLVNYCNGVDAVMAGGVTTFDAMLPYITNQLPKYEKDPVVVQAMKEAMHHNLYALVNSSGMNGIGPNSTIKKVQPTIVTVAEVLAVLFWVALITFAVFWYLGSKKLKVTPEYANFKALKARRKAEKKGEQLPEAPAEEPAGEETEEAAEEPAEEVTEEVIEEAAEATEETAEATKEATEEEKPE